MLLKKLRYCSKPFTTVNLLILYDKPTIIPILQMRKSRYKGIK